MMPPEMCALSASPRLIVFRAPGTMAPRPRRWPTATFSLHIVPTTRRPRRRSLWLGALGHGVLLGILGLGLVFSPFHPGAAVAGQVAAAPLSFLAERQQVDLEPFGL